MLDDTPWRDDAPWIEDDPARTPPIGVLPRRLLAWGIVLAIVGTANQLFDRHVLTTLRPIVDVDVGLEALSIVGNAWTVFGLPLAVGLICLSIALRHLEYRTRPCDGGPHRKTASRALLLQPPRPPDHVTSSTRCSARRDVQTVGRCPCRHPRPPRPTGVRRTTDHPPRDPSPGAAFRSDSAQTTCQ